MISKEKMIELLNGDLKNEWKHLRFYLYHASAVTGLHCAEYKELFLKEAASEMAHVTEFSDVIRGMGGIATDESNEFQKFSKPEDIMLAAIKMEEEVVANYVQRMRQAEMLSGIEGNVIDGRWLEIFLEGQLQASREDLDHFRQMLR